MSRNGQGSTARRNSDEVRKVPSGIPGFDLIAEGGLPEGGLTLVSGTAGSAKTVFASQFLAEGIRKYGERGVLVTFEERPDRICSHMKSLGWDIAQWESDDLWAFVDASPYTDGLQLTSGEFSLEGLIARISHAVKRIGAKRVAMDSLGTMFLQVLDPERLRSELFRITLALQKLGVTTVLTSERDQEGDKVIRYGVEEFVADNVIILRNMLDDEKRRRTLEILKFRGTKHQKGEFPFTVVDRSGIIIIPLSGMKLKQKSSDTRTSSGNQSLDEMCGGGLFRDSIILVSGATGTGKTLTVTQFLAAGAQLNQRCLLFAFEESRDQIFRNARSWGFDFEAMEQKGLLRVLCDYPEVTNLEEHLLNIKTAIDEFQPDRIAVDSLSALERVASPKSFRELVIALTSFIKEREVIGMFTSTTPALTGGTSITEANISTITDSIILLRYVEILGEMRRGIMVLKMRGSYHNKEIREFIIDHKGMHIGRPFKNVNGILAGNPALVHVSTELTQIKSLFSELDGGAVD